MTDARIAVVVVAAGSGSRLGAAVPKVLVRIGEKSILEHALDTVFALDEPAQVIVVAPPSHLAEVEALARQSAGAALPYLTVTTGGDSRQRSVAAGLTALWPGVEVVLVHDAARAFTPVAQFAAVIAEVAATGAGVIPALAVSDTIKQVDAGGDVERTIDRSRLVAVQTPQGFPRDDLEIAYEQAGEEFTDDAALFAAAGKPVTTVVGDALAFKITTPWDLHRAESLESVAAGVDVRAGMGSGIRTGIGIDVHAFDDGTPLWLGGLYWPDQPGLAGHSDGDAVSHAICDALLSAAGLGDIGGRFGTADDRFKGAHGEIFIRETVALITGSGFTIGNVAVQVVANRPKLAGRRLELEAHLSSVVGAAVSVSATTSDGLGFTGTGEGLAAIATALLHH